MELAVRLFEETLALRFKSIVIQLTKVAFSVWEAAQGRGMFSRQSILLASRFRSYFQHPI
jgi:hypothetical protein